MTDPSDPQRYIAEAPDRYVVRMLDGLTLLYHRPSALTHILASPAPEILSAMGGDALNAADIVVRLARNFDLEGEGDSADIVAARLTELAGLGLVHPS